MREWADHVLEAGRHARSWSDAFYTYRERMMMEFFELSPPAVIEDKRPN